LFICLFIWQTTNSDLFTVNRNPKVWTLNQTIFGHACHVFKNFLHVVAFTCSEADLVVSLTVYDL
jgi:hypothetical protein